MNTPDIVSESETEMEVDNERADQNNSLRTRKSLSSRTSDIVDLTMDHEDNEVENILFRTIILLISPL